LRSIADINISDSGPDDQAPKKGAGVSVVRYGIASTTTTQK
jgi:pilus assembly protein CpaB